MYNSDSTAKMHPTLCGHLLIYFCIWCIPGGNICCQALKNNVCTNINDYFNIDESRNCYYNEDVNLETPEIIEKYTRALEIHSVTTQDGYILTIFRILRKQCKGVILLGDVLTSDSYIYVMKGNDSLALTLWNDGYDVWMYNHRGTQFSKQHLNKSTSGLSYWDFSFHEISLYDLSSAIDFIRERTNQKIIFFGYSLGALNVLIYSSLYPNEAEKNLKLLVLVAAACFYKHNNSPPANIAYIEKYVSKHFQMGSIIPSLQLMKRTAAVLFRKYPIFRNILFEIIYWTVGATYDIDPVLFPVSNPLKVLQDFSMKTVLHLFQLYKAKNRFQRYNYGTNLNLKIYGSILPPEYPVENVNIPVLSISGKQDLIATPEDIELFYEKLGPRAKVHTPWVLDGMNHMDFVLGKHSKETFMKKLLLFLNKTL